MQVKGESLDEQTDAVGYGTWRSCIWTQFGVTADKALRDAGYDCLMTVYTHGDHHEYGFSDS